jgi:hypothetical protein
MRTGVKIRSSALCGFRKVRVTAAAPTATVSPHRDEAIALAVRIDMRSGLQPRILISDGLFVKGARLS